MTKREGDNTELRKHTFNPLINYGFEKRVEGRTYPYCGIDLPSNHTFKPNHDIPHCPELDETNNLEKKDE